MSNEMLGEGYATPRQNRHMPKQRLSIGGTDRTSSTRTPNVQVEHLEPKVLKEEGEDVVHVEDRHHEDKKKENDDAAGGDVNVDLDAYRCEEDVSPPVSVLSDELRVFSDDEEELDTKSKGPARSNANENDFDREIDEDLVGLVVAKVEESLALNNKSMGMASPRQAPVICVIPDEIVKDLAT
jgi:hypothetical protein